MSLTYCLVDGQRTHISNVASGAGTCYTCIECHNPVIAKKGKVRKHHFAHKDIELSAECAINVESHAHRLAKDIVANSLRCLNVPVTDKNNPTKVYPLEYTSVVVEKRYELVRPDVVISTEFGDVAVEIAITHPLNEAKEKLLADIQLPTLEIDLKSIVLKLKSDHDEDFDDFQYTDDFTAVIKCAILDVANIKWFGKPKGLHDSVHTDQKVDSMESPTVKPIKPIIPLDAERQRIVDEYVTVRSTYQSHCIKGRLATFMAKFYRDHALSAQELLNIFGLSPDDLNDDADGDLVFNHRLHRWKVPALAAVFQCVIVRQSNHFSLLEVDAFIRKYISTADYVFWNDWPDDKKRYYWNSIAAFLRKFSQHNKNNGYWWTTATTDFITSHSKSTGTIKSSRVDYMDRHRI